VTLRNLVAGRSYKVALFTVFKGVQSSPVERHFTTGLKPDMQQVLRINGSAFSVPMSVANIRAIIRTNSLQLVWDFDDAELQDVQYKIRYDVFETDLKPLTIIIQ